MTDKERALSRIDRDADKLGSLSDAIWDHPEIGLTERFAAEHYLQALEENGFRVQSGIADIPTAFKGTFGAGRPVVGFLAEFDALPGLSQKAGVCRKDPVTEGGNGHGCGHNLLGVGSFAAALAVRDYLSQAHAGTVVFFGCPAEENYSGKAFMAKAHAFDELDCAFSWHPMDINVTGMQSTLANARVVFRFAGKAAHAASEPELGRSALDALELMNVGVQFLREHIPSSCRVHYAITDAGGDAPNVVQDHAEAVYLMRAPQLPILLDLCRRVNNIAKGAALMTDTSVRPIVEKACSNILPNKVLADVVLKNFEKIGPPAYDQNDRDLAAALQATMAERTDLYQGLVAQLDDPDTRTELMKYAEAPIHEALLPLEREAFFPGSSDVGDVSWVCPVAQLAVATLPAGTALHSWQAVAVGKSALAKKGMLTAGKVMAASAIDVLRDPSIVDRAKDEKNERAGGLPFTSPIPDGVKPPIPSR